MFFEKRCSPPCGQQKTLVTAHLGHCVHQAEPAYQIDKSSSVLSFKKYHNHFPFLPRVRDVRTRMTVLNMLRAWEDAPAFVLSCPGPLRRHTACFTPAAQLVLPQCLLGYEAQLSAFVAAAPELAPRMVFSPLPEIFSTAESLSPLAALLGEAPLAGRRPVHLRFGSARTARVMKPARNGAVVAEDSRVAPLTKSLHPFASGTVLPAGMRRVFSYAPGLAGLKGVGGAEIPATCLPANCITADLPTEDDSQPDPAGLEVVSFAEFRSAAWAAGPVRARSPDLRAAQRAAAEDGAPTVLVPWNLDHPGSVVPDLLIRLTKLQNRQAPAVRLLVLPFNYPGQLGLIRRMIGRVRNAVEQPDTVLAGLLLGRLCHMSALPLLRRIGGVAWVDGNDPEHAWTCRRLSAAGLVPILLHPAGSGMPGNGLAVPADELVWVDAETRWGLLSFASHMPSIRVLPRLLAVTADAVKSLAELPAKRRRVAARRAAR